MLASLQPWESNVVSVDGVICMLPSTGLVMFDASSDLKRIDIFNTRLL